jgi:uncharacterized protein
MTVALLDVNVLIALADDAHVHHDFAHSWFDTKGAKAFATCPLTQNAILRIIGAPRYPGGPGTPKAMLGFLDALCRLPGHNFWPDSVSMTDERLFTRSYFGASDHLTDIYLLGLAVANAGRLVTFDRKIAQKAVIGAPNSLELIHA